MKGFTRPPGEQESFREKKWQEASSQAQYNKTLYFTNEATASLMSGETELCRVPIAPKMISGKGDSIRYTFYGTTVDNVNAKTLKVYLGASSILITALVWDTTTSPNVYWSVSGEIFGLTTNNQSQIAISRLMGKGLSPTSIFITNQSFSPTSEDLNQDSYLSITASALVADSDVSFQMGKVELSLAP